MKKPRNIVGPALRALRQDRNLTQAMLVARINVRGWDLSRETLAKIESQVRWVADTELLILADALEVEPGFLLAQARRLKRQAGSPLTA